MKRTHGSFLFLSLPHLTNDTTIHPVAQVRSLGVIFDSSLYLTVPHPHFLTSNIYHFHLQNLSLTCLLLIPSSWLPLKSKLPPLVKWTKSLKTGLSAAYMPRRPFYTHNQRDPLKIKLLEHNFPAENPQWLSHHQEAIESLGDWSPS